MITRKTLVQGILVISFLLPGYISAQEKQEERNVADFNHIGMAVSGELILKQGSPQRVTVEGDKATIDDLETSVRNGELKIKFLNNRMDHKKVKITVVVPDIESLSLSGSGSILANDPIQSDKMDLAVSGSGTIHLQELKTKKISSSISGSGNILLDAPGVADDMSVAISGSGSLKAPDFEVENFDGAISGSGNAVIHVKGKLKAAISGSGNVQYKGNPIVDAKVAGSGRVRSM